MKEVAAILFAAIFTYASSLSAGLILLQLLRIKLLRSEMLFLGFVLGAACLSTLVFTLAVVGLAYTAVFLTLGLILIAFAFLMRTWRQEDDFPPLPRGWKLVFIGLYSIFALLYIGNALLPETSPDGLTYHVALVARYFREHSLPRITTNFIASYPEGLEMLFLFGFAFGRHSGTAMVHLLFLLALPWGMLAYAKRFAKPLVGIVGGLLFFLSPVAGKDGSVAYNDVGLACVIFACFYVLQIWREKRIPAMLFAAGLLAGFAYAVKYNGGLAIVYVLGMTVFYCRKNALRPALLASAAALLIMGPWVIKNIIVVNNPVMPFANRYFVNPYLYPSTEMEFINVQGKPGIFRWRDMPFEATVRGRAQGLIGPVFLLAPLMLLAFRREAGRQLLLAGAVFFAPYFSDVSSRFLLPSLPFIALGAAWAISAWPAVPLLVLLFHAALSWPAVVHRYSAPYCWCLEKPAWRDALRKRPTSEYLRDRVIDYEIGLLLNQYVQPNERVLALDALQSAYHDRQVIDSWNNAFGTRMSAALLAAFDSSVMPTWRYDYRFLQKTVRGIRIVQTARSQTDNWSVAELRVYRAGAEVTRAPGWRLKAWPNPWEVQSAFDNNPVTRWTSGQAYGPGMYLQVDFGAPQPIDEVSVECAHGQGEIRMRLETVDGEALASGAEMSDAPVQPRLRRAAIKTLKDNRIQWLLVHEQNHGANDLRNRAAQWGITPVASSKGYQLYRLD